MENIVNINSLDFSIQKQIPPSIRLKYNNIPVSINDLPIEIASLLSEYKEDTFEEIKYNDVFDIIPKLSIYDDFVVIDNIKDLVIEYFLTNLATSLGSYPFDPTRGNKLKSYLGERDLEDTKHLIREELNNIAETITESIGHRVKVSSMDIDKSSNLGSVTYFLSIGVKINNGDDIVVQYQGDSF